MQLVFPQSYSGPEMQSTMMFNKHAPSPTGFGEKRDLDPDFLPGEHDVICGKGKSCFNHSGNKRFRNTVGAFLTNYSEATTKLEKSAIVSAIIHTVRSQSPGGGFVKLDPETGLWQEVGDHLAREKVGQTIRDALHFQYRSSTKAKKKRRQTEQAKANANMTEISKAHLEISSKIDDLTSKVRETSSEHQLAEMFTQANLEILNELNRLKHSSQSGTLAALEQAFLHPVSIGASQSLPFQQSPKRLATRFGSQQGLADMPSGTPNLFPLQLPATQHRHPGAGAFLDGRIVPNATMQEPAQEDERKPPATA